MATTQAKKGWVHLDPAESAGVIVSMEDHNTVFLPIDVVIRACGSVEKISRFTKQLTDTLAILGEWIKNHTSGVKEAYLTSRDAGLLFLVVCRSKSFNESLEDSLTDLDIQIAQNDAFDLIKLSVLALPDSGPDEVASFLDTQSLKYAE